MDVTFRVVLSRFGHNTVMTEKNVQLIVRATHSRGHENVSRFLFGGEFTYLAENINKDSCMKYVQGFFSK